MKEYYDIRAGERFYAEGIWFGFTTANKTRSILSNRKNMVMTIQSYEKDKLCSLPNSENSKRTVKGGAFQSASSN